jgi:hypothetical protein
MSISDNNTWEEVERRRSMEKFNVLLNGTVMVAIKQTISSNSTFCERRRWKPTVRGVSKLQTIKLFSTADDECLETPTGGAGA